MPGSLRLLPLGGLGEIGMNCMALESEDTIVLVDCGVMFPFRDLGVDIIHPEFTWLLERRDRVRAIVLTHGHEDHIGAVPYLLRELPIPVYGPAYALALVRIRLAEAGVEHAELIATEPRSPFGIGPFEFEPLRVTHSMPDATALVIRTPAGTVVHTGDFTIDETPTDGQHFDAIGFATAGDSGVRLLLSDSTNVDVEGPSGSEEQVADAIAETISGAEGRIVLSLFASNVHRLKAAFLAARRTGRRVCLLGRALHTHLRVAVEVGCLSDPMSAIVPSDRAKKVPPRELLVLATGTQGEAAAALSRLARGEHPDLALERGDRVVLSARIIPGHEQTVFAMMNDFERAGVEVVSRYERPQIHVSGHASRHEQRRMIELVRPRAFIPVHGTYRHLKRHAALADELGVRETLVVENGAIVEIDDDGVRVVGSAPVGRVHVDAGEPLADIVLRDRARLAELGMAVIVVTVGANGEPLGEPEILTRGVVHEEMEPELLSSARGYVARALSTTSSPRLGFDEEAMRDEARRALRRFFRRELGRKPMTYAVVVRVP